MLIQATLVLWNPLTENVKYIKYAIKTHTIVCQFEISYQDCDQLSLICLGAAVLLCWLSAVLESGRSHQLLLIIIIKFSSKTLPCHLHPVSSSLPFSQCYLRPDSALLTLGLPSLPAHSSLLLIHLPATTTLDQTSPQEPPPWTHSSLLHLLKIPWDKRT